jgi:hypothetical protein
MSTVHQISFCDRINREGSATGYYAFKDYQEKYEKISEKFVFAPLTEPDF